ncbi:MAG: hypothetical protein IJ656_02995 [Bacilli bacterium]|nr:hypothetical protein [Bacilli bacterium]MBR1581978.1 hypothetical protein [Bacilli bacterium]
MKYIEYTKMGKNMVRANFDEWIFKSQEHEKNFLVAVLLQVLKVIRFDGTIIESPNYIKGIEEIKKLELKYEEIIKKGYFKKEYTYLKIIFEPKVLREFLDIIFQYDITFVGEAFLSEDTKITIVLHDNDECYFTLDKNLMKIEDYKNKFLNEIKKSNNSI